MKNVSAGYIRKSGPFHEKIDRKHGEGATAANGGKAGEKSKARWRQ
jgi:hypothetical protein